MSWLSKYNEVFTPVILPFLPRHQLGQITSKIFSGKYFLWIYSLFFFLNATNPCFNSGSLLHSPSERFSSQLIWLSWRAREKESEKRIRNTQNKPCGVDLNKLQTEIVIIDPKPYQSTHFSYNVKRIECSAKVPPFCSNYQNNSTSSPGFLGQRFNSYFDVILPWLDRYTQAFKAATC